VLEAVIGLCNYAKLRQIFIQNYLAVLQKKTAKSRVKNAETRENKGLQIDLHFG